MSVLQLLHRQTLLGPEMPQLWGINVIAGRSLNKIIYQEMLEQIPSGYVKIAIENDPVEIVDFPSYEIWWIFP